MKKSDLKQNMIVEAINGDRFIVLENVSSHFYSNQTLFISNDGYMPLKSYDEKLLCIGDTAFDIMRVMKWKRFNGLNRLISEANCGFEVLWERPIRGLA